MSRDPLGEKGGINLYGMTRNDALNRWDWLGLAERTLVVAMGPDTGEGIEINEKIPNAATRPLIPILRNELGYSPTSVNSSKSVPIRNKAFIEAKVQPRIENCRQQGMIGNIP